MLATAAKYANHRLCLVGVGGIDSGSKAQAKIDAGADLLQLYTGLIYRGPGLVKQVLESMAFES